MTPGSGDCGQARRIRQKSSIQQSSTALQAELRATAGAPRQGDKDTTPPPQPATSKSYGGARLMKSELSHKSMSHFHLRSGDPDTKTGPLNVLC